MYKENNNNNMENVTKNISNNKSSSDSFRDRYLSNLETPLRSTKKKRGDKVTIPFSSSYQRHLIKSPTLKRLEKSNHKIINQRKRILLDNYEHRVLVTTKWEWVSFYFTCIVAFITLVSEVMYFQSKDFHNAPKNARILYYTVSLFLGNIPFIWLIGKGIYYGNNNNNINNRNNRCSNSSNNNNNNGDNNKKNERKKGKWVSTKFLYNDIVSLVKICAFHMFVMPIWAFVGLILFASKIICITSICKSWWSILSIVNINYPSSSSGLLNMKEESKKLKLNDVILSTKKRHRRNRSNSITTANVNSVNIIKEIKENADLRRKRLVNNMLNLPRDDLIVDIALLNKLVFLELFLKFLPQLLLSFSINRSKFFTINNTYDVVPLLIFIVSCISTISSIRLNWKILTNKSWASTFNGMENKIENHHLNVTNENMITPLAGKVPIANNVQSQKDLYNKKNILMSPNSRSKRQSLVEELKFRTNNKNTNNRCMNPSVRRKIHIIHNTNNDDKLLTKKFINNNVLGDISNVENKKIL